MKYLFFTSWLRAKEKYVADQVDFERMIKSPSAEEAFKILHDTDYAHLVSGKKLDDLEDILRAGERGCYLILGRLELEEPAREYLFLRMWLPELMSALRNNKRNEITERFRVDDREGDSEELAKQFYYERLIGLAKELKDKELVVFTEQYYQARKDNDFKKMEELERGVIKTGKKVTSGFMSLLSFVLQERKSEARLRLILSAKKMGMKTEEIYKIIEEPLVL